MPPAEPPAPPAPYYQLASYSGRPWADALRIAEVAKHVRDALDDAGVARVARRSPDGSLTSVVPRDPGAPRLGDLRVAELVALYTAAEGELYGVEWDLLIPVRDTVWPATVWFDGDLLVVESAPPLPPTPAPVPHTADELTTRWNLLALEADGREWTPDACALVDAAMARLTPAERAAIGPLRFRRRAVPEKVPMFMEDGERFPGEQPAQLHLDAQGARVDLFDAVLVEARGMFVGTPGAPGSPRTFAVLHELGHAFAHADRSRIVQEFGSLATEVEVLRARLDVLGAGPERDRTIERLAQLRGEAEALRAEGAGWRSAVEAAHASLAGPVKGPTKYGQTSVREGFAESFALFHTDPDALRRTLPEVHAWFAAGGHLR